MVYSYVHKVKFRHQSYLILLRLTSYYKRDELISIWAWWGRQGESVVTERVDEQKAYD